MQPKTIVVTTEDDRGLNSQVCRGFGRSPFYVVAKVENMEVVGLTVGKNCLCKGYQLGLMHSTHHHNVDVILAGGMEPRVVGMFNDLDIKVVTDLEGNVKEVLENYLRSIEPRSTAPHPPLQAST